MMSFLSVLVLVAIIANASAFGLTSRGRLMMSFDLDKAVSTLSGNKILTKTSQLGLLTRLEKAGFTLTSAAPLLKFADEQDLLGVLEASSDKVLPLIGKAIELSPALLPLAGAAIKTPPTLLFAGAAGSLGAAALLISLIPDDSVSNIALQVALGVPLATLIPGALGVGGAILSKLK